ncbi:MAG: hypothetical protein Q9211_005646, partial [Gyalolechia sp. 1 TL-2023]
MTVSTTDTASSITTMETSTPAASAWTPSAPLALTFGLEVEHILLFHSSLLLPHLAPDTQIRKTISESTRLALRQTTSQYELSRPRYNGWGLTSPTTYTSPFGDGWHNDCLERYGVRGYADEIMRVEKRILEKGMPNEGEVTVHDGRGKMKNFENWHLVTDSSLVGATPEELSALLAATPDTDVGHWDSSPVELVSRVLALDARSADASFGEINTMLALLLGSSSFSASPALHPQPQPLTSLHRAVTDRY